MILIRATRLDERTVRFADELGAASGLAVACILDERHGVQASPFPKVSVTAAACQALGLHCPDDFAWRCGDYGYYLARRQFPDVPMFWMIEYDVRFSGRSPKPFFDFFARFADVDFIAAHFEPASPRWGWYRYAGGRGVEPYRCLFPLTRLSAAAADRLLAKRVAHSRQPWRRFMWPNDESFVATSVHHWGLPSGDINGFGRTFYDPASFSFLNAIDGDSLDDRELRIYHPVAFGEAYARKVAELRRTEEPEPFSKRLRKFVGRLLRFCPW